MSRVLPILLCIVAASLTWIATWSVVHWLIPAHAPTPDWSASADSRVPPEFQFLMYPADSSVQVYDAPDGKPLESLTRAVANSQRELNSGGWCKVLTPGPDRWARLSDLRFNPPTGSGPALDRAYVSATQTALGLNGFTASTTRRAAPSGATLVTFRVRPDDDHVEEYVYEVRQGVVTPVEMTLSFGPGGALADLPRLALTALIATGASLAILGLGIIRTRQRNTRTAPTQVDVRPAFGIGKEDWGGVKRWFTAFQRWRRRQDPPPRRIVLDGDMVRVFVATTERAAFSWNAVEAVHGFKRDLFAVDLICLAFAVDRVPHPIEVDEEMEGYAALVETMTRRCPDLLADWWHRVAFPAFATNETLIWRRGGATA